MRSKTKKDLKVLGLCMALFAVVQVLINLDIIGPFWELNLVLIGINIILAENLSHLKCKFTVLLFLYFTVFINLIIF